MPPATQLHLPLPTPQPGAEGADSLPDRLCALIVRRGRPLEVGHVAAQLLRLRRCPERLQRRLVAEIVEGDARLAWLGRDLVGLAPPDWSSAGLESATFCVVDLETTGGSPGLSKVTEIGAVRVRAGEVVDRFATLVNPNRPIPPIVTELTGIDDAMVAESPDIEDALAAFVDFAGQDVLVAHNAPFDLRFLNYERRRLASRYFTQPWLDTLVLARRLLDGQVPRHDLGTLAGWADTSVRPIHRALPDAEATAEVLVVLLGLLTERGVDTLERAVAFAGTGGARHAYKLALAEELPALPGVYLMRDRRGRALYVGKAADLRRRVRAYFGPGGRHGRLIGRALERLESIDHEVCGSEFAALLRENDLIKGLSPPCNRRGAGAGGRFLKISLGELAPRLYVVPRALADGAAYFGPIRSERLAREAVACLHTLYPLGAQDPAARDAALAEVEVLLAGDSAAVGRLGLRVAQAVAEGSLQIDPAGEDGPVEALLGALGALARVRRAARRSAVVVEPGRDAGTAEAFIVAGGIVRSRAALSPGDWRDAARVGLDVVRRAERRPAGLAPDALDEVTIVEARLLDGAGSGSALRLPEGWRTAEVLSWIECAVALICTAPAAAAR
ncbi:MAG TPA: exonuclease domain-containing protein [Miltoncostaeaceae bacterium]|nr:exonuclease domain-containing protein [Miltoncostaeaceae bacterium]